MNEASYGTKYLTDSVKIAKTLKDMFDKACTSAARHGHVIKNEMMVYGFLISGVRIEFVKYVFLGGRLFLFKGGFNDELPLSLNKTTLLTGQDVLVEILLPSKRIEDTANKLED
ncbi:hypothetical protein BGZ76_001936 [Entomortierella beljakovae]|nr:hypothetical protein BGZ76_001936 [Entomortierella beljakovae]